MLCYVKGGGQKRRCVGAVLASFETQVSFRNTWPHNKHDRAPTIARKRRFFSNGLVVASKRTGNAIVSTKKITCQFIVVIDQIVVIVVDQLRCK